MKCFLVSFSGIDGAGKSTQIEKLKSYLAAEEIPVRQLAFWDDVAVFRKFRSGFSRHVLQSDGSVGAPDRPARRRDKNLQTWPLLAGRSILHLADVINLRRVVSKNKSFAGVIIFDRYLYDQLAALPLDRWWARTFAKLLLSITPKPDISYLLDAIPEEARQRKPEYPLDFMHRYRSSYLELRSLAGLTLIPASDPDEVHLTIRDRFSRAFQSAPIEPSVSSVVIA